MAEGLSEATANAMLDAMWGGTSYAGNSTVYIQLHTGAPGAAGTSNIAGNNTRHSVASFDTSTGGQHRSTAAITWTSVSTAETYSKFTAWTASTSGTFICSGQVTTSSVSIGDTFAIPSGSLFAEFGVAG